MIAWFSYDDKVRW